MSIPNGVPQSPEVVLADDLVAERLEDAGERIADDRAAQVADVHLLRDVRRRVVDDHLVARRGKRHAEPRVAGERERLAREEVARERDVDEAGARDLDALGDAVQVELRDDGRRDLARCALERLGEAHREVRLVVGALRAADHRIDARMVGAECRHHGGSEPLVEDISRIGHLFRPVERRELYGQPQRRTYAPLRCRRDPVGIRLHHHGQHSRCQALPAMPSEFTVAKCGPSRTDLSLGKSSRARDKPCVARILLNRDRLVRA